VERAHHQPWDRFPWRRRGWGRRVNRPAATRRCSKQIQVGIEVAAAN
jgi:hypothetical protein